MKLLLLLLGAAQGLRWPWATRRLATCEGRTFVPVTPDECPEELDITTCDDPDLGNGDLCEADGLGAVSARRGARVTPPTRAQHESGRGLSPAPMSPQHLTFVPVLAGHSAVVWPPAQPRPET